MRQGILVPQVLIVPFGESGDINMGWPYISLVNPQC